MSDRETCGETGSTRLHRLRYKKSHAFNFFASRGATDGLGAHCVDA